jgi:hypothetical protein
MNDLFDLSQLATERVGADEPVRVCSLLAWQEVGIPVSESLMPEIHRNHERGCGCSHGVGGEV